MLDKQICFSSKGIINFRMYTAPTTCEILLFVRGQFTVFVETLSSSQIKIGKEERASCSQMRN